MIIEPHYFNTKQRIDKEELIPNSAIDHKRILINKTIEWFDFEVDIKYRYEGLVLFYPTEWKIKDCYDGFYELSLRKKMYGKITER